MGASLLRFWHHCYGADGRGGAVAAVTEAARHALHQLAAVPVPAGQGAAAPWCEGLFKCREEVSSAFSVAAFLSTQQVRPGDAARGLGRAALCWVTHAAVALPLRELPHCTASARHGRWPACAFSIHPQAEPPLPFSPAG